MNIVTRSCVAGLALAFIACTETERAPQSDRSLIQGKWSRVAVITDSQSLKFEEGYFMEVSFSEENASFILAAPDGKVSKDGGRYIMNESATPPAIDFIDQKGDVAKCCYRVNTTELIIVFPSDQLRHKRPTSVDDPEQGYSRIVFRRGDAEQD